MSESFIRNPLETLTEIIVRLYSTTQDPSEVLAQTEAIFVEILKRQNLLDSIPLLTSENCQGLSPWTLVRLRGMVQDHGSESEFCKFAIASENNQHRISSFQEEYFEDPEDIMDYSQLIGRFAIHLIPVPAESPWKQNVLRTASVAVEESPLGEYVNAENVVNLVTELNVKVSPIQGEQITKISRLYSDYEKQYCDNDEVIEEKGLKSTSKRSKHGSGQELHHIGCSRGETWRDSDSLKDWESIVTLYSTKHRSVQPALNSVIDVIGILKPSMLVGAVQEDEEEVEKIKWTADADADVNVDAEEEQDSQFDLSKGRRLFYVHALYCKEIPISSHIISLRIPEKAVAYPQIYKQLCQFLSTSLGGDALAAQYLLCHMASGVYRRVDTVPFGNLPINFMGPNAHSACAAAYEVYKLLCEQSSGLCLSANEISNCLWVPSKDCEKVYLKQASLQLAHGTHLIIDETSIQEGALNTTATKNVLALQSIISSQTVEYLCPFCSIPIETDYPTAVFSGGKSIFREVQCVVPLEMGSLPGDKSSTAQLVLYSSEDLDRWRTYLQEVRRSSTSRISESFEKQLRQDLEQVMAARPQLFNRSSVIFQNTHYLWFVLARMLTLLHGKSELDMDIWNKVKSLECSRWERLNKRSCN